MKLFIAALASVAFATDVTDNLAAQEAAIASADAAQDAVLTQAEIDEANELSWTESFTAERADDLVTIACLCYDELSTWDLRPMSFPDHSGYYLATEGAKEVYFNPCNYLNFDSFKALDINVWTDSEISALK